jgi:hypothetical protein
MVMHVEATPSAPSGAAEQPVSAALDRVVLACLEKDPARRPSSVDRLGELLASCDVGKPWAEERARRWWDRHAPAAAAAASAPTPVTPAGTP